MTGGTINTPAPAITATVPTTAHKRPTHRGIRKRRSSWSVIAEKYTAARTARKTRMRTSATRRTNQMTRAAMKSATNVAPGDRAGDVSVLSGTARRRRPGRRPRAVPLDRKSTRLNSSHDHNPHAGFRLQKKKRYDTVRTAWVLGTTGECGRSP